MYIVNIPNKNIPEEDIFKTNRAIAEWLIENCGIPLLGRGDSEEYFFMKTEELFNYLKIIPFWYDVSGIFS